MKKHFKWIIPVLCITLILTGTGVWWSHHIPKKTAEYISEIEYPEGENTVSWSDCVFVGYVEETHDYFSERRTREFPEVYKNSEFAMTECVVRVIKNIKGDLKEGETYSVYKNGGISKYRLCLEMEYGEKLPESGKYYVICAFIKDDGRLSCYLYDAMAELEAGINKNNITDSEVYKEYLSEYEDSVKKSSQ